ncbi:MAG: hypothetical protein GY898_23105 [Proteobacteria bacterium]|nr:hypothetical protein [Pseudomonadota bacterium]
MTTETTSPTTTELDPELHHQIEEQTALVIQEAQAITIGSQEDYEGAGAFLTRHLKPALKKIEETWRPMQRAADANKKAILDQRREVETPLLEAEKITKKLMGDWTMEQRRIEAAEQRKAEAEARRIAEEEKLAAAAHLEDQGHQEAAVERLEAPTVPVMPAPVEKPKAKGTSARTVWKHRVIDEAKVARAFLTLDEKKISGVVRQMGPDAVALVGGIEVFEEPVISARAQ